MIVRIRRIYFQIIVSLRASAHTGVAIRSLYSLVGVEYGLPRPMGYSPMLLAMTEKSESDLFYWQIIEYKQNL